MRFVRLAGLLLLSALLGCSDPLPLKRFADEPQHFDPLVFFTGHVRSWGVLENRSGEPTQRVVTDCVGEADGTDGLHMVQHLTFEDEPARIREWHMRRTGPQTYEATANDMVGVAHGEAAGRAFHWRWTLATDPGNRLADVTLEQWMYLTDTGVMMNRTIITKLGFVVVEVTEAFSKQP
jgi:hypothetical protein